MDTSRTDIALALIRAVVGGTFLLHGLDKLGDLDGTQQFFDGLGIPAPALMAPFVASLETAGGIALILGALTPIFALGLAFNMLVAGLTTHTGSGFFVADGGYELVLLLGIACTSLVLAGAGRFSVDAAMRLPGFLRPLGVTDSR
jgi:putative oxidoreductase